MMMVIIVMMNIDICYDGNVEEKEKINTNLIVVETFFITMIMIMIIQQISSSFISFIFYFLYK